MIKRSEDNLSVLMQDDALLDEAVARAQADAIRRHRLLGQPVAAWRDGRVVIDPAHERDDPQQQGSGR